MVFKVAVKGMNDTIGEIGLVPTRLVFGVVPQLPIISTNIPTQKGRMEIVAVVQAKKNAIIAESKITTSLTRNIPLAADRVYKLRKEPLVYSEKEKRYLDCCRCKEEIDNNPIG